MSEECLTETEQKVFDLIKKGFSRIDDISLAMKDETGRPFPRGLIVIIAGRLLKRNIGVQKQRDRETQKTLYTAAQA